MKSIVVAAPASGHGKTTVTLALMAALKRRVLAVAPFKVGPDFIDPGHHTVLCGRPSRNLDGWMCGRNEVEATFAHGCRGADVAVIEGVMGLFDGAAGDSQEGSTAEVAQWLGSPVLLVVDAARQARSAAALVKGFAEFDPALNFAGVIFNRVGSERHARLLREAVASVPGLPPLLGCLPRSEALALPERHLGLVTSEDHPLDEVFIGRLADWLAQHVDIDALLESLPPASVSAAVAGHVSGREPGVRIGVARDEAFCFYYPENLERLEAAGAELVFFSPLRDRLPEDLQGLYLGGGYPEMRSERLAANRDLLGDIREAAECGLPIYAECGGFMLLAEHIDGHTMAGIYPAQARMLKRRKALGYREVVMVCDTPLGPSGTVARGHEFHYSEMTMPDHVPVCYRLQRKGGEQLGMEGYRVGNVLGSYVHLHFASNPQLADNFVEFCRKQHLQPGTETQRSQQINFPGCVLCSS